MKKLNLKLTFAAVAAALCSPLQFLKSRGLLTHGMQPTPQQQPQTAHTAAATFTDTTYAISASLPATYDAAGYAATAITYTQIGKVDQFPEIGSVREVQLFKPIAGSIEKLKGSPDYGSGDMTCADVPADAGQVIVKAAEASANHYSMKITYPDSEVHYLDVIVSSWRLAQAVEAGIMKRMATINVCKAPVIVAAT